MKIPDSIHNTLRRSTLVRTGVFSFFATACVSLGAQSTQLFDFEALDAQGWVSAEGDSPVAPIVFDEWASSGEGMLMVSVPVGGFKWAAMVDIPKGSANYDAIVAARTAATPMSVYFDVGLFEENRPEGVEGWLEIFLTFGSGEEGTARWDTNRYGDQDMLHVTWDATEGNTNVTHTAEYPLAEQFIRFDPTQENLTMVVAVNNSFNGGYAITLDNFRLAPSGGDTGGNLYLDTWPINDANQANAEGWLHWLHVENNPWVWSYSLENFIYIEETSFDAAGAWIYVPRQATANNSSGGNLYLDTWPINDANQTNAEGWLNWLHVENSPWVWSYSLENFIYIEETSFDAAGAWIYVPRQATE